MKTSDKIRSGTLKKNEGIRKNTLQTFQRRMAFFAKVTTMDITLFTTVISSEILEVIRGLRLQLRRAMLGCVVVIHALLRSGVSVLSTTAHEPSVCEGSRYLLIQMSPPATTPMLTVFEGPRYLQVQMTLPATAPEPTVFAGHATC